MTETYELSICADCLVLLANGEYPPEMTEDETAAWIAGMEQRWPIAEGWVIVPTCPDDCEGGFSWSACDLCGTNLGGERHPATAWQKEGGPG